MPRALRRPYFIALAVFVVLSSLLTGCTPTPEAAYPQDRELRCTEAPVAGTVVRKLEVGDSTRTYRAQVPEGVSAGEELPLVFGFHGLGGTAKQMQNSAGLHTRKAVTVFPEGVRVSHGDVRNQQAWAGTPYAPESEADETFVRALIDAVQAEFCIDPDRVHALGFSNGGSFVSLLACQDRELFQSFASLSGAYYRPSYSDCESGPPAPMLSFHGTGDTVINYAGGTRHGSTYLGVNQWMQEWAREADCGSPVSDEVSRTVTRTIWLSCRPGVTLEHYRTAHGAHAWPKGRNYGPAGDQSATDVIGEFFSLAPVT